MSSIRSFVYHVMSGGIFRVPIQIVNIVQNDQKSHQTVLDYKMADRYDEFEDLDEVDLNRAVSRDYGV